MSVTNKTQRVNPTSATPYIKGTEAPNYYLVLGDTPVAVYGFRPLHTAVPASFSNPQGGVSTRIRVVPHDQSEAGLKKFACVVECVLGFSKRHYSGETQVHFSTVTTAAPALVAKLAQALALLA